MKQKKYVNKMHYEVFVNKISFQKNTNNQNGNY